MQANLPNKEGSKPTSCVAPRCPLGDACQIRKAMQATCQIRKALSQPPASPLGDACRIRKATRANLPNKEGSKPTSCAAP